MRFSGRALHISVRLLAIVGLFWLTASPSFAEVIRSFDVDLAMDKQGMVDVTETITMDFESSARHGIYRLIPVTYRRNDNQYSTQLSNISVVDDHNQPLKFHVSDQGSDLQIKIGDGDVTLTGVHIYKIHYAVRRALNFFAGQPELYWNITGNEWPYPIENVNVHLYPPDGVKAADVQCSSYVGSYGSKEHGEVDTDNIPIMFYGKDLQAGEGLTIVADLPEGSIAPPTARQELVWFITDWWPVFTLPLFALWAMLSIWFASGRDPVVNETVAVEWDPPTELSPAEVGTIIDEGCDINDIVATVIDLAARGYLKITELPHNDFLFLSSKDYKLERMAPALGAAALKPFEQELLEDIFADGTTTSLSQLKDKFYVHLPTIKNEVFDGLTSGGYLSHNPQNTRSGYSILAVLLCVGGFIFLPYSASWGGGLILTAIIIGCVGSMMSARTLKGVQAKQKSLGFQRFVTMAEKDRIAKLAKDDPTIFGRMLPYALVLGAADQWANAFHGLMTQPPSWYVPLGYGSPNYNFSSQGFVHDLGGSMQALGQGFSSAPSGSSGGGGGGFSGGGFGGGGGGSW